MTAPEKYSKESRVVDPVHICDSCQKFVFAKDITKHGKCPSCGNKKVRSIMNLSLCGYIYLKYVRCVDKDFIARFESPAKAFISLLTGGADD